MSEVKRTERGWAGHFICSHTCLFRRNTLLEKGKVRIVVSTVGNMLDPLSEKKKIVGIGFNRYYETMAFHASYDGTFWDADVTREVSFYSHWVINEPGKDLMANDQHEEVVKEIASRMEAGEFS